LKKESSSIEEDRLSIERKDTEDDDDDGNGEEIKLYDNLRVKDSIKINSSSSSAPPEETSHGNSSNNSNNNNKIHQ
jgi:hypothetical protein